MEIQNATQPQREFGATIVAMADRRSRSTKQKLEKFPNRIREIRLRRALTQDQLAEKAGMAQQTIGRLERGDLRLKDDQARTIARELGVSPGELFDDQENLVPVVGRVGAGAEVFPFDDHPLGEGMYKVRAPAGLDPKRTVAVEIHGDSMPPAADGWLAFYRRDPEPVAADIVGKTCVVKVAGDGPTLLKVVRRGPTWGRYNLMSTNTSFGMIEDVALEWAAPIRAIVAPELAEKVA